MASCWQESEGRPATGYHSLAALANGPARAMSQLEATRCHAIIADAMEPSLPRATWRLLITPPADGATNMAVDEAILHALADGVGQPTVRFYQWQPPCLSLGYNQTWRDVNTAACAARGYTWLRRPTGGRAILHIDELTYSIIAPEVEPRVHGGITESYRRLSQGLLAGLRSLGADVFQAQDGAIDTISGGSGSDAGTFDDNDLFDSIP